MPRIRSAPEPKVMTWPKAAPVLVAGAVCDAARAFFSLFWLFGPALAAVACTYKAADVLGVSSGGVTGYVIGGVCTAAAAVLGTAAVGPIEFAGIMLSMATGLIGFMSIGLWIIMTNARIFKANEAGALWFVGGFALSEVPLLGALPSFTGSLIKLYRTQIRVEKEAHKKWQKENEALMAQERQQQILQIQAVQEREQQIVTRDEEAANDDRFTQEQAA